MITSFTIFAASAALMTSSAAQSQDGPPPSDQAKQIEELVNRAAALIDQRRRAAFDEFRKCDSEWWSGNTYLFAYGDHLNVLLNPAFPKREGTNPHSSRSTAKMSASTSAPFSARALGSSASLSSLTVSSSADTDKSLQERRCPFSLTKRVRKLPVLFR
ncbi:hypothetical protein [Bradyrhizobium sp. USDA 3458]|uniref:hypothetical protein n=1 Tax=Bradyrhizobium sp. USDA 3458 TaxID=2591461 RepID=UPI0011429A0E|nr:hypothetical protein [Bradyrhizobium sp. USDA 3458]